MQAINVKFMNHIKCEMQVLQQNQLDTQSGLKEYSTSMSENKPDQRRFPPGSLYRRPSEVSPHVRASTQWKASSSHLPFQITGYSIPCERHPQRNEDSFLIDAASGLMAVFDGVGGSAAGEIAAQTAEQATRQRWKAIKQQHTRKYHTPQRLEDCEKVDFCALLQQLLEYADEQVRTDGALQAGTNDLATTVAIGAVCRQGKNLQMFYAHVGDSRVYLLPEHGALRRLTVDDGLLGRLVENQMMSEDDARRIDQAMSSSELTDLELSYFRHRGGITQALGGPLRPNIHLASTPIAVGDRVLLCTDGIHDNLTDEEIEKILRTTPRHQAARSLVEHALLRSRQERHTTIRAKPDDMTAIVLTRIY
jgi:serine/threonine protein phosphatase PrpC